jgi:hypothetical protein
MTYQITKQITFHNQDEGWFYELNTDEYGTIGVYYELRDGEENQIGSFHIPKDCIETFISVLQQLK